MNIKINQYIILNYLNGENILVSYGLITGINEENGINHRCNTDNGSSGSPILSLKNNKLIGIHYGSSNAYDFNKGTLIIYAIIEFNKIEIKNEIKNEITNKNEIKNENSNENEISNENENERRNEFENEIENERKNEITNENYNKRKNEIINEVSNEITNEITIIYNLPRSENIIKLFGKNL